MSSTVFDRTIVRSARVAREAATPTRHAAKAGSLMAIVFYVAIGLTAGAIAIPAAIATGGETAIFID